MILAEMAYKIYHTNNERFMAPGVAPVREPYPFHKQPAEYQIIWLGLTQTLFSSYLIHLYLLEHYHNEIPGDYQI